MIIDKQVNPVTLDQQLRAAGVETNGLRYGEDADGNLRLLATDADGMPRDFTPEEQPVVQATVAKHSPTTTRGFETAEDAERLALVAERAAEDPAFAALADLTIGRQGV